MTTQRQQISGPTPLKGYSAMDMANSYVEDMGISDPQEVQLTQQALILVGEYLHESGHTLAWNALDPPDFFTRIAFMSEHEREGIALILVGVYVWLCTRGFLLSHEAEAILSDLAGLFPASEILRSLHGRALRVFRHLADMPLLH